MNQSGYQDLLNNSIINVDQSIIYILILPNLNPNSVLYLDSTNTVADIVLNDGQIVIGSNGAAPVGNNITGSNDVIVTNGPGTITLSTPQPIGPTASPTFTNITVTNNVIGLTNSRLCDDILSCSTPQVTGNLLAFSAAAKVAVDSGILGSNIVTNVGSGVSGHIPSFSSNKVIQDSGIVAVNIFLADGTVLSTGDFNLNTHALTNVTTLNTKIANDLVTGPASAVGDNLCSYNLATGKVIKDSGISTASVTGGPFLRLSGASTMLGNIDTGGFEVINTSAIRNTTTNIIYGAGATSLSLRNIAIGNTATIFSGSDDSIVIGSSGSSSNLYNVVVGNYAFATVPGCVVMGHLARANAGGASVVLGFGCLSAATQAHVLGASISNSTAGSLYISTSVNIRSAYSTCDLGTSSERFASLFLNGSISGPSNSRTADNIVSDAGTGTTGRVPTYTGTKVIQDSGVLLSSLITGATAAALYVPYTGATTTLAMGSQAVTGSGANSAGSLATSLTTDSTTTSTGTITTAGGIGVAKAINAGGAIKSFATTASSSTSTGAIISAGGLGVATAINAGGIIKTTDATASSSVSTGSIIAGGGLGVATAINAGGIIKTTDATASSSVSTGSIIAGGGLGVATAINAGGIIKTTDATASSSVSTGSIIAGGGLGVATAINAGGIIKTTDATDSTSTTTGSLVVAGGIGCTKQIRSAGKITVSTAAGSQGIDLATADSYADLRVIQNTTGSDNHMYLGFNSGTTSTIFMYTNNNQTFRVEGGANIGLNGGSYGGGVGCFFIANRTTAPTSNPTGGGILYCESGALKYRGSAGTVSTIAPA